MDTLEVKFYVNCVADHILRGGQVMRFIIDIIDEQCCKVTYTTPHQDTVRVEIECGNHPDCYTDFAMYRANLTMDELVERIHGGMDEMYANYCEYSIIT